MINLIAGLIAIATFMIWGWFLLERTWQIADDLDAGFFWSIIPVAIALWIGLHLLRM
jgi:TRAP-type C4-dicarboxylate transport system permease small subunit